MFKSSTSIRVACFAVATLSQLLLSSVSALSTANIWINEIHYDNDEGDVGEFIELVVKDGVDLTGLQIRLYNGYNGEKYGTNHSLAGLTLQNVTNGFGFIVMYIEGIQNGAPDGIVLNGPGIGTDDLIQFLSYEGYFNGEGGPADGSASDDIGVEESDDENTPIGYSLQLAGTGLEYSGFHWTGPFVATPGSINVGQYFPTIEANEESDTVEPVSDSGGTILLSSLGLAFICFARRKLSSKTFALSSL